MENNQLKYLVYCTTCIVNKKIYVGVHKTYNSEQFDYYIGNGVYVNQPSTYKYSKNRFQKAVNKYGPKSFIRTTIKVFDNEEDAFDLEKEIVNTDFLKRDDVYNVSLGGKNPNIPECAFTTYQYKDDGTFIKEHYSMKEASISVNRSFRTMWRAIKEKSKCAGYYWTTEYYEKLDLTKMKKYEGLHKIPVFQYSENGEYDCCYESINDAGRVLKIHSSQISRAIKLGVICNGKYFLTTYSPNYSIAKNTAINSYTVYLYDLEGNYISEYKNMLEAKNKLNINGNIYSAIKLGQTCGGFQWSFEKLDQISKVLPKSGKARKVGKYDKDWNLIEEYRSLAECKRINGSGMYHVITGRNEFAKGYRYKYID